MSYSGIGKELQGCCSGGTFRGMFLAFVKLVTGTEMCTINALKCKLVFFLGANVHCYEIACLTVVVFNFLNTLKVSIDCTENFNNVLKLGPMNCLHRLATQISYALFLIQ